MAQTLNDCNLDTEYCVNTIGSFDCFCKDGYNRSDGECNGEWRQKNSKDDLLIIIYVSNSLLDIDECMMSPDMCGQNSTCQNEDGNYTCKCDEGFTGDGKVKCIGE